MAHVRASVCVCVFSCSVVSDSATPWTIVDQAPLSMEFSSQEYYSGLPFSPPGALPDLGIEPASLVSSALAGGFSYHCAPWEASKVIILVRKVN